MIVAVFEPTGHARQDGTETAQIGDEWLAKKASVALIVPSVIVTREVNYLLNCEHPDYPALLSRAHKLEFSPDTRLRR